MAVDAAKAGNIQYRLGQDQTVGHHHQQVRLQRGQFGLGFRRAQGLRLIYRQIMLHSQLLDCAGGQLVAAPGRAVRLAVDRDDIQPGLQQSLQVGGGEVRGTGENDA